MKWAIGQKTGSGSAKAVLVVLAEAADDAGLCWPSQRLIAARADVTKRTVISQLAALERLGLITRTRHDRENGSRSSDRIRLSLSQPGEASSPPPGARVSPGTVKVLQQGGEEIAHLTSFEPSIEPHIEPASSFESFWQACPKKVGKKDAAAAFERVVGAGDATVEQLVAGMVAYGDQVRSEGTAPKFIKGPAGWLLGARWDDGEIRGAASCLSALPAWPGPAHILADIVRHHEKSGVLVSRFCGYRDLPTKAITTSWPHVADVLRSELRDLLAHHGLEVVCNAQVAA
ncbi:helix-turn-helix domain-containing protein [Phenylobacterium sp.]|uniref:helix-turn-helix domain-containing protein n=1 Tax=Phenylobacterium sp. TaxID=1871053 RepID=UPI00374D2AFC